MKKNKKSKTYTQPVVNRQIDNFMHWDPNDVKITPTTQRYVQYKNKEVPVTKKLRKPRKDRLVD